MGPALATLIYITAFTYIPLFSSFHSNLESTVKSPFKVRTYNSIQEYTSYTIQPPKCLPNLRSSSSSLPTTRWATQESPLDGTWFVLPLSLSFPPSNNPSPLLLSFLTPFSHLQTTTNTLCPIARIRPPIPRSLTTRPNQHRLSLRRRLTPRSLLSRSFERRRCVREVFEGERKSLEADREAGQLPRTGGRV